MSRHVWLVKRFGDSVRRRAESAFRYAVKGGLSYNDVCRFVGYAEESVRQKGKGSGRYGSPFYVWGAAVRSRHLYRHGHNRENYRLAGERLVEASAAELGLSGAPPQAVYDYYTERR
jgi:hypothetical protein